MEIDYNKNPLVLKNVPSNENSSASFKDEVNVFLLGQDGKTSSKKLKDLLAINNSEEFSFIVYTNTTDPNTSTIFSLENPPIVNDPLLQDDSANLYISNNSSSWVYNTVSGVYTTHEAANSTSNFYITGTTTDAGSTKTGSIEHKGTMVVYPAVLPNEVAVKAQVDTKVSSILPITTIPGTSYALDIDDYNSILLFTNVNPVTLTIPTDTSVAIPIGTSQQFTQQGTGVVTVGGAGVTIVTDLLLSSVQGETRTLTKIGTNTWSLEGNHNKVQGVGTIYVSSTGNDSTGIEGNILKPFASLNAAIPLLFSSATATKIEIISNGTFTTTASLNGAGKLLFIESDYTVTLNINSVGANTVSSQKYLLPLGTLNFNPASNTSFNVSTVILVKNMSKTSIFSLTDDNAGDWDLVVTGTLTLNGGKLFGTNNGYSRIIVNILNCVGVSELIMRTGNFTGLFNTVDIKINSITHNNTLRLLSNIYGIVNLEIGNISGSYAGAYFDLNYNDVQGGGQLNLKFNNSIISTNCGFRLGMYNDMFVTGVVKTTANFLFSSKIRSFKSVISDFYCECVLFCGYLFGENLIINNSTIKCTYLFEWSTGGNGQTYPALGVEFIGVNQVITTLPNDSDPNQYATLQLNLPTIKIKGVLYTNAKFNELNINVLRTFLNQYNDSTIII
jgi:hypothetical protein